MPKKILVADDSETIQRSVAVALEEFEVSLVPVKDPGQVLAKARESMPDLILLDHRMNRHGQDDGYNLCSQLKADPNLGHIPVIFLAGLSFSAEKGDQVGAMLAISKPFETGDFAEKVMNLVEASEALSGEIVAVPVPTTTPSLPPPPALPKAPAPPSMSVSNVVSSSAPKVTTAIPAFQPVNPASVLPDGMADADAGMTPEPPLTPPPLPYGLPASQQEDLRNVATAKRTYSPPPMPAAVPSAPPAARPGSSSSIPRPQGNALDDAPQTVEYASSKTPLPAVSESPRRTPLIIPPPSDEAAEFPVKELLQSPPSPSHAISTSPSSHSHGRVAESELEMASPEYIKSAPPASRSNADFALDPQQDYLARALAGSRSWPRPASPPSSSQEAAQMEYIRQLSLDVIERVVWEVVPELAEHIIKEAVARQHAAMK